LLLFSHAARLGVRLVLALGVGWVFGMLVHGAPVNDGSVSSESLLLALCRGLIVFGGHLIVADQINVAR
jgi:hypothetical protein